VSRAGYVPPHARPEWIVRVFRKALHDVRVVANHEGEDDARAAFRRHVAHMHETGHWAWVELLDADGVPSAYEAEPEADEDPNRDARLTGAELGVRS
jgi:hypothetical protein